MADSLNSSAAASVGDAMLQLKPPQRFKRGRTVAGYLPEELKRMAIHYLPLDPLPCDFSIPPGTPYANNFFCVRCGKLQVSGQEPRGWKWAWCDTCLHRRQRLGELRRHAKDRHPHGPIAYRVTKTVGCKTTTNTIYRE